MRQVVPQGLWLYAAAAADGLWPVSVRCANGVVAALLSPRWHELFSAPVYTAGRRLHGPRSADLPPLAARLDLLGELRADVLSLVGLRSAALQRVTVLTVTWKAS